MFTAIFFATQILAIYTIILLLLEQNKTSTRKYLITIIIILAVSQIPPFISQFLPEKAKGIIDVLPLRQWVLLIGPGVYFYCQCSLGHKFKKLYLLHLIPSLLWWLIFTVVFILRVRLFKMPEIYGFFSVLSLLGYGRLILYRLTNNTKHLRDNYSYTDIFMELRWLYMIALTLITVTVAVVIGINTFFYLHPAPPKHITEFVGDPEFLDIFHGASVLVFIFAFSLMGQKQERHIFTLPLNKVETDNVSNNLTHESENDSSTESDHEVLRESQLNDLINYMNSSKIFLENKLSLQELSDKTGYTRHELSKIINDSTGDNFFHFVNGFRAREFKNAITENRFPGYNLLGIAMECGFNSKATFNSAIKREFDKTPSQIIKEISTTL